MVTITIPKKEYQKLFEKALRYEYIRQMMEEDLFAPPPTRNAKKNYWGIPENWTI